MWSDIEVPEVLLSGHHAKIRRWRRDRALEKTSARRPDLIEALDVGGLDKHDKAFLATLGWEVRGGALHRSARGEDLAPQGAPGGVAE